MTKKVIVVATLSTLIFIAGVFVNGLMEGENEKAPVLKQSRAGKPHKKDGGKTKSESPEMHSLLERELRTQAGDSNPKYSSNQVMEEFEDARLRASRGRNNAEEFTFIERGPGNVGGRTRAVIVDPEDPTNLTWFAGSATGGIWKTVDAGEKWTYISEDIPNLGTNTLVMSEANPQVIYAGTGEHFTSNIDGAGMFKSMDKGVTWSQIANPSTLNDFKNVSRIIVNPANEDELFATTRNSVWAEGLEAAIYKTLDGGANWTRVRSSTTERFDDIDFDPTDFNTLYVAIETIGVIKSVDGGETWTDASEGMFPDGRVEITVSPVNPNRLWASAEGALSGGGSDLYVTSDAAESWSIVLKPGGAANEDFLGDQGWYDNIVTAHPFDENLVYAGGINLWQFGIESGVEELRVLIVGEEGSDAFMDFVDFGGEYLAGGLELGDVPFNDLVSVELRFGQGTQLAHRFTVNGQGAGVPASGFIYQDYVEVPFQAWNTETGEQLMMSFRDQQENGAWNLIPANTSGVTSAHAREYLYIHKTPYDLTENPDIAQDGGNEENMMYFFWPVLAPGATFDAADLPFSELVMRFDTLEGTRRLVTNISDAYDEFGGLNEFNQSPVRGVHPDQHNIVIYDKDDAAQTFRLMIANDGGLYASVSSENPGSVDGDFDYHGRGYNTSQFYSADKAPGEDRFVGGTQDNGTWYNGFGDKGSASTLSVLGIGGDGFEALWHSTDINKILGGSQFNNFFKTEDGGSTWTSASGGFSDTGPFRTRLSHSKNQPNTVYTVGAAGVWKSENFGSSWAPATMRDQDEWSFTNSADVEVSLATSSVIWAGGRLQEEQRLFVSFDGDIFRSTSNYELEEMGPVSGIATHPDNFNIAYALFSFAGSPKVLRTTDLGQNWEDISGFDGTGNRGFPDVAVNTMFVFPENTDRLWVGSEVGIIESLDNGLSWNLLESNMPPVNIHDFKFVDDVLVIATFGRGIWSVSLDGPLAADEESQFETTALSVYPNPIVNGAKITVAPEVGIVEVFNMNGQRVDGIDIPTGQTEVIWEPNNLTSGLYFIRYELDGKVESQKIIIR